MKTISVLGILLAVFMSNCSGSDSQNSIPKDSTSIIHVAEEPDFLYTAVTSFALTDSYCFIIDAGGVMLIEDRKSHQQTFYTTGLDSPQMVALGQNVIVVGRWSEEIQVWDSPKGPKKSWKLKKGMVRCLVAFGDEAMLSFSENNPSPATEGKDVISLLPSQLMLIDSAGNLDSNFHKDCGGIVTHLAFNGGLIVYCLQEQPKDMHFLNRKSGEQFQQRDDGDVKALANGKGWELLNATGKSIFHMALDPPLGVKTAIVVSMNSDDPAIIQLAYGQDGRYFLATSDGVLQWKNGKKSNLTTEQPAKIEIQGNDLLVLENGIGLRKIGKTEEWIVKFPIPKAE